ncbi:MAG: hypothetical protein IPL94_05610 [Tetrasphaera sp.]|jgi:uncharacterized membrane-anchored protein|nr:hypothetical protein [Tetrasphaera sp.]
MSRLLSALRPRSSADAAGRPIRVDARTKRLTKRLQPGEIAVIDHADLDRVSAEALIACRPSAVVNAARSISGRYPNVGPQLLMEAGVPLLDAAGPEVMAIPEGTTARVVDSELRHGDTVLGSGTLLTSEAVEAAMTEARAGMSEQLELFATNTLEYMRRERDLLFDSVGIPDIRTRIEGRHALIVVRGYHYKEDLDILRGYIREYRPVLIGVDGGADALLEAKIAPHIIVGDMDSVSDAALKCGAELVVHAYRDGRAPGMERIEALGLQGVPFPAAGTSEDIAMLLADDKGAELIVAVGTHATLDEFLDKGRAGMSSTFLTRLRVGSKLVDAKGVSRLYRNSLSAVSVLVLLLVGLVALGTALWATEGGRAMLELVGARLDDVWAAVRGWWQ